jgi:hypothetical protein
MLRNAFRKASTPQQADPAQALGDLRFRNLLSHDDWLALPRPIRERFSKRAQAGAVVVYAGEIEETRLSAAGYVLCQLARLIGGPFPLFTDPHVPAVVTVTEDCGGQMWTRIYGRPGTFPQVIHSAKQFAGPTGLEEYVGRGVGMALRVGTQNGALVFRCAGYFLRIGSIRMRLPGWLTPGALTVTHAERGDGRFIFALDVVHPLFGLIIHQLAVFQEVSS